VPRPQFRGLFANVPIGQRIEASMSQIHQVLVGTLSLAKHLGDDAEHFYDIGFRALAGGAFYRG
jgi:hypothetical protein